MLERGLISVDDDPHSPPQPSPPHKNVSQHLLPTTLSSHQLQDYHSYKNLQPSLPITAVNEQQQPKDLKPTLPTQSLLKTSLLATSSMASITSSSSSSSLTTKPTITSMQFQETKRQRQNQLNITQLPIQQYNSILHTHLMSKQGSTSSTSLSSSLSAGCNLTTSTYIETSSSAGTANCSLRENHQHNLHLNHHNQQLPQSLKQKQQNQPHLMQEIDPQQLQKTSSSNLTATLLPHFVISTSSSNSSNTNNSNNNLSKNNFNCINDVSNNITFNSLSSNNSNSNKNNTKSNSWPKNSPNSYQGQSANAACSTATTSTVTTQTEDVAGADTENLGMNENNAHLQMIPSNGVSMESSILNTTTLNSVAGGTITRREPSNHHEAVTVVVFKTLLPDD